MTYSGQAFASPQEALAHHGIKGMKWGVRKKEDTGGGTSGSSAKPTKQDRRETKAKIFEGKAAISDVRVSELHAELAALPRTGGGFKTSYKRANLTELKTAQEQRSAALRKDAEAARSGKLTSNQKKMLIGGVAVGALAGLMVYSTMKESGQLNSLTLRGQAALHGEKTIFKRNELLGSGKLSPDGVLKSVVTGLNPNYASPGGQMNCRRCSFAYEMRRRGFDVVSTPTTIGYGHNESGLINALTPGQRNRYAPTSLIRNVSSGRGIRAMMSGDHRQNPADVFSIKNREDNLMGFQTGEFGKKLSAMISSQPHGARGEAVFDFGSFGHSMSWENFGGKPVIFDTQKGVKYDLSDPGVIHDISGKWGIPRSVDSTRLDNVKIDEKFVSRWVTNNNTSKPRSS